MKPDTVTSELDALRAEIERIDETLVQAIERRMQLARRIGQLKRESGLTLVQPAREAAVVRRAAELARATGIDGEAVREIFWRLIEMSRKEQEQGAVD